MNYFAMIAIAFLAIAGTYFTGYEYGKASVQAAEAKADVAIAVNANTNQKNIAAVDASAFNTRAKYNVYSDNLKKEIYDAKNPHPCVQPIPVQRLLHKASLPPAGLSR